MQPDDLVECTMELTNGSTSTWDQTCVNQSNGESVCSYTDSSSVLCLLLTLLQLSNST